MTGRMLEPPFAVTEELLERARRVRLLLFDVDGVLTDGRLILGDDGQEHKAFNSKDGHGIKMLARSGVEVGIITGRSSRVVEHRVRDLAIPHVYQGCHDKLPVFHDLTRKLGLAPEETAYVGDDVVDLPIMLETGLACAVADAHPYVRRHAHWVTPSVGGAGAAREICELILMARGAWETAMMRYFASPPSP